MRLSGTLLTGLLMLLGLAGPAPAALLDQAGRPVPVKRYHRIASLAPSMTELIYAIGWQGRLAGVSDHCDYPPAARQLPRVGGAENLNVERMVALHPDLMLTVQNRAPAIQQASRLTGAPVVLLENPTLEAIAANAELLGTVLGPEGAAFARRFRSELAAVKPAPRPVRVFYLAWDQPLMTVGPGSYLDDLIRRAGGRNVGATGTGQGPYPMISEEQLIATRPQVLMYSSNLEVAAQRLAGRLGKIRLVALDADDVSRPGPRVLRALRQAARALASQPGS